LQKAAESVNNSDVAAKLRESVHLFPFTAKLATACPFGQDIPMKGNVQLLWDTSQQTHGGRQTLAGPCAPHPALCLDRTGRYGTRRWEVLDWGDARIVKLLAALSGRPRRFEACTFLILHSISEWV